jgi:methionine-R-sulfoxide reductase
MENQQKILCVDTAVSATKMATQKMKPMLQILTFITLSLFSCQQAPATKVNQGQSQTVNMKDSVVNPYYSQTDTTKLHISNAEWKKVLSPDLFEVSRNKGTEYAFSGEYWDYEGLGTYFCAACGNKLFRSDSKFSSTCGWPSFFETLRPNSVIYHADNTHGMQRTEVVCGRCDGHLGHLFDDGPEPTGKRYCMNSIALHFEPDTK